MNTTRRLDGPFFATLLSSRRPWVMLTIACAVAVAAGSLGPWLTWDQPTADAPEGLVRYGLLGSGAFTLLFAIGSVITLLASVRGWDADHFAWVAVGLLGLCAITGLFEWLLIVDRPASSTDASQAGWGMIVVGLAGLAGTIASTLAARALHDT